jgi:hypothetical protein
VTWRREATHRLVAATEVQRLTGFDAKEILLQRDTQRLVRIDEDGRRHEFVRIPVELLNGDATAGDDSNG